MKNRHPVQVVALLAGAAFLLVGILGFVPGITIPGPHPGHGLLLGIFAVNAVHNVAHILLGIGLIWGGRSAATVGLTNRVMAAVFAVLGLASFFLPGFEGLPLNPPDTVLHLASAALTGYLGFVAAPASAVPV